MNNEQFQNFFLQVILNIQNNHFKKECLWILQNVFGGVNEECVEVIVHNKELLQRLV
jgi:hypothetical protein